MTKNHDRKWAFCPRRAGDAAAFFGPSTTEKTVVEARGRKIFGELPVTVGGRGRSDARFSHTYARVCAALAITEAERGVGI